jgi:hypothetical protein
MISNASCRFLLSEESAAEMDVGYGSEGAAVFTETDYPF